jgi:ABC-2 type transport system permease protein
MYANAANHVEQISTMDYLLIEYGLFLVQMVVTATIAFMLSTIFRSSALAIVIAILAYLVGSTLVQARSQFSWVKYILFTNTNLAQYVIGGRPDVKGMTMGFSITVMVVYFVIMMGLSWFVFTRRDVSYA